MRNAIYGPTLEFKKGYARAEIPERQRRGLDGMFSNLCSFDERRRPSKACYITVGHQYCQRKDLPCRIQLCHLENCTCGLIYFIDDCLS